MTNEREFTKAPPRTCKVVNMLIEGLLGDAEGAVSANDFVMAYGKVIMLDEMMTFYQVRCEGD